jgi:hypothetical protein
MADRALITASEAWPYPAEAMEQWLVGVFLDDGRCLLEVPVEADSRENAAALALQEAGRNGIDTAAVGHMSVELADESRHVYTGGWCDASDSYGCMIP